MNKTPPPPIDWLWAATLERRAALKVSIKDLAKLCNVSYGTMRNYCAESPWEWPRCTREKACKALGIIFTAEPEESGVEVKLK